MDDSVLSDLLSLCEAATKHADRSIEELGDLLARARCYLGAESKGSQSDDRTRKVRKLIEFTMRRVARPVAVTTVVRETQYGPGEVSIDNGAPFRVPRQLAELLIFAGSGEPDNEGVVSPRSLVEAEKLFGSTRHVIINRIYKLRRHLVTNHFNKYLLETLSDTSGVTCVRFLTRRLVVSSPPVVSIDSETVGAGFRSYSGGRRLSGEASSSGAVRVIELSRQ